MEYNTMMITGQKVFRNDSLTFGQAYDQDMHPIYEVHFSTSLCHLIQLHLTQLRPKEQFYNHSLLQIDPDGNANFTIRSDGTRANNFTQSSSPDFTSLLPVRNESILHKACHGRKSCHGQ